MTLLFSTVIVVGAWCLVFFFPGENRHVFERSVFVDGFVLKEGVFILLDHSLHPHLCVLHVFMRIRNGFRILGKKCSVVRSMRVCSLLSDSYSYPFIFFFGTFAALKTSLKQNNIFFLVVLETEHDSIAPIESVILILNLVGLTSFCLRIGAFVFLTHHLVFF